jgi:predicted PurR-regulated permease PerM
MENETLLQRPTQSGIFYTLGTITITILLLIYFDGILKPFIVALIFWYLIKELKTLIGKIRFRGKSLPGWLTGLLSVVAIGLIVFGVFEVITLNVEQMSAAAPDYRAKLDQLVTRLSAYASDPQLLNYVREAVSKINFAKLITDIVNSLSSIVADFAVVVVYIIFMLMEEAAGSKKIDKLFPVKDKAYAEFQQMTKKINNAVRGYMINMLVISFITAVISYFALIIIGVDFPVLWAFLIFILNFIPYIGPFISSFLPALLTVFQFGDLIHFVYVFAVLETIQIILGNFVQPKMMGKSLNISALTVILVLAFWGSIWGVVGMILAVPITSIMIIVFWQIPNTKWLALMASEEGDLGD